MKRIAVLTSGGDAPGMNAAIRAVVRSGIHAGMEVYGIERGYEGLLDNDIRRLQWSDAGDIIQRGGTVLKTARCERFLQDEWIDVAAENLTGRSIDGVVVIGGDGTFRGGAKLAERGVTVVGIPATIDNDLAYTDFTIGFKTAVSTVLDLITKIRDTSSSHERTTIIEVMGRHCGDLALYAGITGGADAILVPEVDVDIQGLVNTVRSGKKSGKLHNVIVKAEGVDIPLSELAELLEKLTGQETRTVVPGYIQRGGSPVAEDRLLASLAGAKAVKLLDEHLDAGERKSFAIGMRGNKIFLMPLAAAINYKGSFNTDIYELANVLG